MAAKDKPQKKSSSMGCLWVVLGLWMLFSALGTIAAPHRASDAVKVAQQPNVNVLRGLLREAGNADVAATGPWDEHTEARFSGLVKALQPTFRRIDMGFRHA